MLTVADVGEAGLVARIQRYVRSAKDGVVVGVGDDAALVRALAPAAVLTTDMLVENVDFAFAWAKWADVGHKAAAVNLSDLAAMGAEPRGLLLSLALRPTDGVRDVMALVATLADVGNAYGAPLVGGDLSKIDGPVVASVTAIGEVDPRKALRRYGGCPGDIVLVSGSLGEGAAGLLALQRGIKSPLTKRQLRPTPRVELGRSLAKADIITSAADISDGLARDALHVAAVGCGVAIDPEALPIRPVTRALAKRLGHDVINLAVAGGEDFELVLSVEPNDVLRAQRIASRHGVALTPIGTVTKRGGLKIGSTRRSYRAFEHFR
ncbi:MAG: thiamine-phosphate kinase [Clostridia bacterium]|nr:thiamine-phosphate kinase [Deltaproteobacteria bacterium]